MSLSFGSGCDGVHEQAETTTGTQTLDTTVREAAGTSQPPQPSPVPAHPDCDVQREGLTFRARKRKKKKEKNNRRKSLFCVFARDGGLFVRPLFPEKRLEAVGVSPSGTFSRGALLHMRASWDFFAERRNSRKVGAGEKRRQPAEDVEDGFSARRSCLSLVFYALLFWTGESR